MASIGHRLFRRRYRSFVRVEGHGVFARRPVRVEHVVSRGCHHGFLRHLCAAIHFGEPARKRIAIARQRGQFPVGITVGHRPCLRRFCSAVRVESHGVFLCPLCGNVLDTGCARRNFPDHFISVLVLPAQEFISRFIQVFFRRKFKLSARQIIVLRRVAIHPFAAVQIVIEFVIDFSVSGYVSLNRSIHIELRAVCDFQPAIFPNRDRCIFADFHGFSVGNRHLFIQRRIAHVCAISVLNERAARMGQRIFAFLIFAKNTACLNNAAFNQNRVISFRAMALSSMASAAADIIVRVCSSCCYNMSAFYDNGIKPEAPASADSGRMPSAYSRNVSALDEDFCAAGIADARPRVAAICDKASFSVNGQWNGFFIFIFVSALHIRRINSRIVAPCGELIRPNESQRGFSCLAEIQRTVSAFIRFATRVNRQATNRQRRLNTWLSLLPDLHPEVIAVRRSAERIVSLRFYRQKMFAESIIVRRQFFVGSGQRHTVTHDRLRFCQTPPIKLSGTQAPKPARAPSSMSSSRCPSFLFIVIAIISSL